MLLSFEGNKNWVAISNCRKSGASCAIWYMEVGGTSYLLQRHFSYFNTLDL